MIWRKTRQGTPTATTFAGKSLVPNCYLEPPFHANFGGKHCYFGDHIYANFNLTVVDDTHIYVGDHTMLNSYSSSKHAVCLATSSSSVGK